MLQSLVWSSTLAADFYEAGLGRFLVSPGFGGAAALLGGLLAYVAAQRKINVELHQLDDGRERVRQERWWDALTWIYDRATAERPEARLTGGLVLDLLERLEEEAHTDLELQAVAGLIGLLSDEREEREAEDA